MIALTAVLLSVAALALACGDDGPARMAASGRPTAASTSSERLTLRGALTLDGAPGEARFLGARVVRDGLAAACQASIPGVSGGRYEIQVFADAEVRGCGAPGAEVLLWTHDGERFLFSRETMPWPTEGALAAFDASFSTAAPNGASAPATEIKGLLFGRDGAQLPDGSVVEAYVDETLCGITSLRNAEATEGYFTLIVAGPDAIAACGEGATLTFRIDGRRARETAANDLRSGSEGHELNLTIE
jgi:hypothetical protein